MAALSTAALVGVSALSAGTSLYSASQQAEAGKKESEFNAAQMDMNARLAARQGEDAIGRGDKEAATYRDKVNQTVGSQRAALAAQGIDVNSGSAAEVQLDTKAMGEKDAMTIKNNAWREAWGYKVEAQNNRGSASMTRQAGENRYNNTLLTGGLQALNSGISGAMAARGK